MSPNIKIEGIVPTGVMQGLKNKQNKCIMGDDSGE